MPSLLADAQRSRRRPPRPIGRQGRPSRGRLYAREDRRHHASVDERDVTILMRVLFDMRSRVVDIHEEMFPPEDENGEPEEEEDT
jgi:hypothetical protein